jgi:alpha-ketoglutarate-dependent 2,4-dichlorophenoxyacetate dioxygenase
MLTIISLQPLFAARMIGLDLTQDLDDATFATVRDAFQRYSVLVFPHQKINDDQQIRFSERFGQLEATRAGANGAGSKLIVLTNIAADGSIGAPTDKQVLSNRANQIWHTDSSFKPIPARASLLSAREIPSQGGDTQYASMRAAYAALSDEDKHLLEGLVAVHDFGWSRSRVDTALMTDAERADNPPVRQPVVMDSPYGKALYLGAHARSIEGMDEAESRLLIDRLIAFGTQERFVYTHPWAPNDLILWDNRAVLHRATPFQSTNERRHMVRTTVAGPSDDWPDGRAANPQSHFLG